MCKFRGRNCRKIVDNSLVTAKSSCWEEIYGKDSRHRTSGLRDSHHKRHLLYRQDQFHQRMVGKRGQRDPDCPPRRFGKTLNMSMVEKFFSIDFAGKRELFEGLAIWQEKSPDGDYRYRRLQGTCPVVSLSFAKVKAGTLQQPCGEADSGGQPAGKAGF